MADPNGFPNGGPGEGGAGGDQNMCSFIASFFHQRQSVERLLHWLRESQTACTDTNCFDEINGLPGTEIGNHLSPSATGGDTSSDQATDVDNLTPMLWLFLGLITLVLMNMSRRREGSSVMD